MNDGSTFWLVMIITGLIISLLTSKSRERGKAIIEEEKRRKAEEQYKKNQEYFEKEKKNREEYEAYIQRSNSRTDLPKMRSGIRPFTYEEWKKFYHK